MMLSTPKSTAGMNLNVRNCLFDSVKTLGGAWEVGGVGDIEGDRMSKTGRRAFPGTGLHVPSGSLPERE